MFGIGLFPIWWQGAGVVENSAVLYRCEGVPSAALSACLSADDGDPAGTLESTCCDEDD